MNQTKLLQDFEALPTIAQQEVVDFIGFMQSRYGKTIKKHSVEERQRILLSIPVWDDDSIQAIETTRKAFNSWNIETF
jgi:hypothetical protein